MGNWRRANVVGTCGAEDVKRLEEKLSFDEETLDNFGPLVCGGIAGLPNWGRKSFDVVGNLAERDYSAEQVGRHLEKLRGVCPSLRARVHLGGDYEVDECVETVVLGDDGKAAVVSPEVEALREIEPQQMDGALLRILGRVRG